VNVYDAEMGDYALYGAEIWLRWNTTFIEYVNHTVKIPVETYPDGFLHEPVMFIFDDVNTTDGVYRIACTLLAPAPGFSGDGTVFEITFQVKYQPKEPEPDANFLIEMFECYLGSMTCIPPYSIEPYCHVTICALQHALLTVESSPSGVMFTMNDTSKITPWSGIYNEDVVISLIMPETYILDEVTYCWDRWIDGENSRTRVITLNASITLTAIYTSPSTAIGGTTAAIKLKHSSPWIATVLLLVSFIFVSNFYLKKKISHKLETNLLSRTSASQQPFGR
jgi:hypothetical protein